MLERTMQIRPPQELVDFAAKYKIAVIQRFADHRAADSEFERTLSALGTDGFEHRRSPTAWGIFEAEVRAFLQVDPSQALTPDQVTMVRLAFDAADIRVPR